MRYLFIDSNIFFNHWYLASAEFTVIADLVNNSSTTLLVSELVSQEVQNLYQREHVKAVTELKQKIKHLESFLIKKAVSFTEESLHVAYDFKATVEHKFIDVVFLPYGNIPNEVLVTRAIEQRRPFREKEKGFRDTLIWLSFVSYLSENVEDDDEVVLITDNSSDFFDKAKSELHPDLALDLNEQRVNCKFKVLLSLKEFVKELEDTPAEYFSAEKFHEEIFPNIEVRIEEAIDDYFSGLSTSDFRRIAIDGELNILFKQDAVDFDFQIHEGIEDPDISDLKKVGTGMLYVYMIFNLRKCSVGVTLPQTLYYQKKDTIDRIYGSNGYLFDDGYYLNRICRPQFSVSFIYDLRTGQLSGFQLHSVMFI